MSTILTAETEAALDRIVQRSGETKDQIANRALQGYVAWYELEEKKIVEAHASIDRGDYVENDQFFDQLERRFSA